jgi:micrococcal nuclease
VLSRTQVLSVAMCAVVLGGCGGTGAHGRPGDAVEANATVERAVDGDTLVVDTDGVSEKVRLIGINTPESVDRNRPVMCFGKEASTHMADLLPPGTAVRLVRDVEPRDRYDRLLAYVYRASDGEFVNLTMVTDGYAQQYTFPPNVAHTEQFGDAERRARASRLGLWGSCEAPFEE